MARILKRFTSRIRKLEISISFVSTLFFTVSIQYGTVPVEISLTITVITATSCHSIDARLCVKIIDDTNSPMFHTLYLYKLLCNVRSKRTFLLIGFRPNDRVKLKLNLNVSWFIEKFIFIASSRFREFVVKSWDIYNRCNYRKPNFS